MINHNGQELYTYTVPGQPIAWARPRHNGRTFFDSQKSIKANWAVSLQYQKEGQPFYTKTPLEIIIHFYFSIPATYKQERRHKFISQPFTFRPDVDNAIKFVLDSCNAILFDDDCSIFKVSAEKIYDLEPRTEFAIIPHTTNIPFRPTPKRKFIHILNEDDE